MSFRTLDLFFLNFVPFREVKLWRGLSIFWTIALRGAAAPNSTKKFLLPTGSLHHLKKKGEVG